MPRWAKSQRALTAIPWPTPGSRGPVAKRPVGRSPRPERSGCGHTHTSIRWSCGVPPWFTGRGCARMPIMDLLKTLVEKGLRRELPTRDEALAVLATSDDELLDVVAAAG